MGCIHPEREEACPDGGSEKPSPEKMKVHQRRGKVEFNPDE
jgi:hypothetical protein